MHLVVSPICSVFPETLYRARREDKADKLPILNSLVLKKFGPQSYPSPPMSDSPSPLRRISHKPEEVPLQVHTGPERGTSAQYISREPATVLPALAPVGRSQSRQHTEQDRAVQSGAMAAVIGPTSLLTAVTDGSQPPTFPSRLSGEIPPVSSNPFLSGPIQTTPLTGQPSVRAAKPARRNKAHVASACVNCKRAHLSCDVQRPCARCIAGGKQDTCYDVQHKKRGRPKLREGGSSRSQGTESGKRRVEPPAASAAATASYSFSSQQSFQPSHGFDLQNLRSPEQFPTHQSGYFSIGHRRSSGARTVDHPVSPRLVPAIKPFAILDMNLVILRHNKLFQDVIGSPNDLSRTRLADVVDASGADSLQRLRTQLREERDAREPAYLPPILDREEPDALPSISESDIDQLRKGNTIRSIPLAFKPPYGRAQTLTVSVALARTNVFFVTLVIMLDQSPRLLMHPPFLHSGPSSIGSPPTTSPIITSRTAGLLDQRRSSTFASTSSSPYLTYPSISTTVPHPQNAGMPYAFASSSRLDAGRAYFSSGTPTTLPPFPTAPRTYVPVTEVSGDPMALNELLRGEAPQALQLPPILSPRSLPPTVETVAQGQDSTPGRGLVRPRDSPSQDGDESYRERKRTKFNIHEILK